MFPNESPDICQLSSGFSLSYCEMCKHQKLVFFWRPINFFTKGKSMKKALLLAASVAFVAPQAFAQAKSFEGFSVGANLAVTKTTTDLSALGVTLTDSGNTSSLDLQAQYSMALGPQFVMGFGLTLGTGTNKAGTFSSGGSTVEFASKNRTAIDFIPGYAVSNNMMLFGKVSALNADGVASSGGVDSTKSLSGIGYGFGVRGLIDKNMFYQVGYDINKYNDITNSGVTFKASSTVLTLGVGYKF